MVETESQTHSFFSLKKFLETKDLIGCTKALHSLVLRNWVY